jgi:hypothetical protein
LKKQVDDLSDKICLEKAQNQASKEKEKLMIRYQSELESLKTTSAQKIKKLQEKINETLEDNK